MGFDLSRAVAVQSEGKALPYHPAFASSAPTTVYSPGRPRENALISQREAGRHGDAYGGRQAIDWVYDAIGLYSDACATAQYRLEKPDGTKLVKTRTKGTPPDHKIGPQDLYRLLDSPNPFMLYDELISLLVIDLLLVGNAYWFKWQTLSNGQPLALYRLAPSHVKIIPGEYGPKRYEYAPPGIRNPMRIKPEQLIHFRRPNPHSAYYGMGVIQGAGRSMDLEIAITDTIASYYENRADPSLIVQSERRVPRDVFNKLRAQLRGRMAGSSRAGELLVLEAGLKASSLSPSASNAMFDQLSKMSRNRVLTKFRTSPMLFGLMDEAAGSNKVSDARREFDNSTLKPFMARVQRQVTASLTSMWDCNYIIDHEQILPPEEAIKVAESISKAPGMKVRDVRRAYRQFGIEESTGDAEIDEIVLNLPGEDADEDGQPLEGDDAFADRPIGSEPGRPPLGENTRAFPAGAKVRQPAAKALTVDQILARIEKIPEGKSTRLPGEQRPDDTFATARKLEIDLAQGTIESGLRDAVVALERGLLDTVEGKALKSSDLVNRIKRAEIWKTFESRVRDVLREGITRSAASGVMQSGMTPSEEVDYDEIAEELLNRPDGVRSIVKTLKERVTARVKAARDGNAERAEYEQVVRTAISEWAQNQASMIADSEATEAYNEGTIAAAQLSGVTSFFVVEEEDAPDEACQDARGQVWDVETARSRRKEHPRCRRAFIPLTGGVVS